MNSLTLPKDYLKDSDQIAGYLNYQRLNSPTRLVEEVQLVAPRYLKDLPNVSVTGILSYLKDVEDDTLKFILSEYEKLHMNPVYKVIEKLINNYPDLSTKLYPLLTLSPKDAKDSVLLMFSQSLDTRIQAIISPLKSRVYDGVYTSILSRHGRISVHHKYYPTWKDEETSTTFVLVGQVLLSVRNGKVSVVYDWESSVRNADFLNLCRNFIKVTSLISKTETLKRTDEGYKIYESSFPLDSTYIKPSVQKLISLINSDIDYIKCSKYIYSVTLPDGTEVTVLKTGEDKQTFVDSKTGEQVEIEDTYANVIDSEVEKIEEAEFLNESPFSDDEENDKISKEDKDSKNIEEDIEKLSERISWIEDRLSTIEESDNHVKDDEDIKDYYLKLKGELSILQGRLEDLKNKTSDREDIENIVIKDSIYESYTDTMVESQVNLLLENSLILEDEKPYFLTDYQRLKLGLISRDKFYEDYSIEDRIRDSVNDTPFVNIKDETSPNFIVLPVETFAHTVIDPEFRFVYSKDFGIGLHRKYAGVWYSIKEDIKAEELLSAPSYLYGNIAIEYSTSEMSKALQDFGVITPAPSTMSFIKNGYYLLTSDILESETLFSTKGTILQYIANGFVDGSKESVDIPLHLLGSNNCIPISTTLLVGNKYTVTDSNGISKNLKLVKQGYSSTLDMEYTFVDEFNDFVQIPLEDLVTCQVVPL